MEQDSVILGTAILLDSKKVSELAKTLHRTRLAETEKGTYVACEKCGKTRYVQTVDDPAELYYDQFECEKVNLTCSSPEKKFKQSLVRLNFVAGSIVWAQLGEDTRDKWPAIVEDSPDEMSQFYIPIDREGYVACAYFVTLLGYSKGLRYGYWLPPEDLVPFQRTDTIESSVYYRKFKQYSIAFNDAKRCLRFSLRDRLSELSFLSYVLDTKSNRISPLRAIPFSQPKVQQPKVETARSPPSSTKARSPPPKASPPPQQQEEQSDTDDDGQFRSPITSPLVSPRPESLLSQEVSKGHDYDV